MAAEPTPGPWLVDGAFVYALNREGHNRFSAAIQRGEPDKGEDRVPTEELLANTLLIAAAPNLFAEVTRLRVLNARLVEALEAIAERMEGNGMGQWKEARAARAALAAARLAGLTKE